MNKTETRPAMDNVANILTSAEELGHSLDGEEYATTVAIIKSAKKLRAELDDLYNNHEALLAFVKDSPCYCEEEDGDGDAITCERCALLSQLEGQK